MLMGLWEAPGFSRGEVHNNWITAKWINHDGKLMITNLPFTIMVKTQLLTGDKADKAINVDMRSSMITST